MNSQAALADLLAGLGQPTTTPPKPAGPPCLDPWCADGVNPCGHTPDAHFAHHGAAAIIAGQPTTTQASALIAATAPATKPAAAGAETGDLGRVPAAAPAYIPFSACTCPGNDDGTGHSHGCRHWAAQMSANTPPPSTVAEMREVLTNYDATRPRSMQTELGPSELGTPCQRQIAMKLAGVTRQLPDKRPSWAPMQGTAMHTLMEKVLRFHNAQLGRDRWVIEERLHMDAEISGAGDALDTDTFTVVDWKYVGKSTLAKVKRKTIPNEQLVKPEYRVQGNLYGLGHERAGRRVDWVRLVFLARTHDYNDSTEWTEPYQPDIALRALDRYYATQDLIGPGGLNVANNPTLWAAVPAAPSDDTCAWCPFKRIGGPADASGCPGNTEQKINKQLRGLIA